jgi:hypothetical protein
MAPGKKNYTVLIATIVPPLPVIVSGVMKFSGSEMIVQGFTALGVARYLPFLGTAEIVFAALFIPRRTMKLGFMLLSCYFAGAMATEVSHGMVPYVPAALIAIVWICTFIRDRSAFISSQPVTPGTP